MKTAILLYLAILLTGCNAGQDNASPKRPLIAKDTTDETERKNTLFVFVGEKIEVKDEPNKPGSMDNKFTARYKVLQRVYGNYGDDEITFTVFDHYGWPAFADYRHVLLFVSEDSGKFYHEKYMYNDVYKTKGGRWAGCYAIDDYEHPYNHSTTVKPEIIDFTDDVSYPTQTKYRDGSVEEHYLPGKYFKIVGDKAIAVYGNYIEDLFRLKKEGVLTARELFGHKPPDEPVQVKRVVLEEFKPTPEKQEFITFFKEKFIPIIKTGDLQQFKYWSYDSIPICNSLRSMETFESACFQELFTDEYISSLSDSNRVIFSSGDTEIDPTEEITSTKHTITKKYATYKMYSVKVEKKPPVKQSFPPILEFVKTQKGFALIGIENYYVRKCCQ